MYLVSILRAGLAANNWRAVHGMDRAALAPAPYFRNLRLDVMVIVNLVSHSVPPGTRSHPDEASKSSPHFRLIRGSSWIWKSRKAVSQRRPSPCGLFSRAEDALKRR